MKILVHVSNTEVHPMIRFALEGPYLAQVIFSKTATEALELLIDFEDEDPFDVVILSGAQDSERLCKLLSSLKKKPPCITVSGGETNIGSYPELKHLGTATEKNLLTDLSRIIEEAIADGHLPLPDHENNYCKIQTDLLIKVAPLSSDVFIQINPTKFLRIFQAGDVFDESDLQRYRDQKKVEYFYILNKDAQEFLRCFQRTLSTMAQQPDSLTPDQIPDFAIHSYEAILQMSARFGFTPEVQSLVKDNIALVVNGAKKVPNLHTLLSKIQADETNYIPVHSVMVAHIAGSIAIRLKWDSNTTIEKLSYAAFFHDLSLKNNALAMIDSLEEFREREQFFPPEEAKLFLDHPVLSADLTTQFKEIPPDVYTIISQHHERPNGTGFPRKLSGPHIASLTAVFMIAHDMVQNHIKYQRDPDDFLAFLKESYPSGHPKKVVEALERLLTET